MCGGTIRRRPRVQCREDLLREARRCVDDDVSTASEDESMLVEPPTSRAPRARVRRIPPGPHAASVRPRGTSQRLLRRLLVRVSRQVARVWGSPIHEHRACRTRVQVEQGDADRSLVAAARRRVHRERRAPDAPLPCTNRTTFPPRSRRPRRASWRIAWIGPRPSPRAPPSRPASGCIRPRFRVSGEDVVRLLARRRMITGIRAVRWSARSRRVSSEGRSCWACSRQYHQIGRLGANCFESSNRRLATGTSYPCLVSQSTAAFGSAPRRRRRERARRH